MKKREIIYLHGLLGEIRRHLDRKGALSTDRFEAYEEYGVGPTSIHRTKGEHEEAVRRLLDGLVGALRDGQGDGESAEIPSR